MYIMCVCLFSALSCSVDALQISILLLIIIMSFLCLRNVYRHGFKLYVLWLSPLSVWTGLCCSPLVPPLLFRQGGSWIDNGASLPQHHPGERQQLGCGVRHSLQSPQATEGRPDGRVQSSHFWIRGEAGHSAVVSWFKQSLFTFMKICCGQFV